MHLKLLSPKSPTLNQKANGIALLDLITGKYNDLIDSMFRLASGEQQDQRNKILVGLSAIQVGYLVQIILVDKIADGKGKKGKLEEFINPKIIWSSKRQSSWYEGCFSTGNITGVVERPKSILVFALNRRGLPRLVLTRGYRARIFGHEIDHGNGIRFPDRISDDQKLHIVKPGEWPQYRDKQGWKHWPSKATRNQWLAIKNWL